MKTKVKGQNRIVDSGLRMKGTVDNKVNPIDRILGKSNVDIKGVTPSDKLMQFAKLGDNSVNAKKKSNGVTKSMLPDLEIQMKRSLKDLKRGRIHQVVPSKNGRVKEVGTSSRFPDDKILEVIRDAKKKGVLGELVKKSDKKDKNANYDVNPIDKILGTRSKVKDERSKSTNKQFGFGSVSGFLDDKDDKNKKD